MIKNAIVDLGSIDMFDCAIVEYECPHCGATLELESDAGHVVCDECGKTINCSLDDCLF